MGVVTPVPTPARTVGVVTPVPDVLDRTLLVDLDQIPGVFDRVDGLLATEEDIHVDDGIVPDGLEELSKELGMIVN